MYQADFIVKVPKSLSEYYDQIYNTVELPTDLRLNALELN